MSIGQVVEDFEAYFKGISEDRRKNPGMTSPRSLPTRRSTVPSSTILKRRGTSSSPRRGTTPSSSTAGGSGLLESREFDKLRADLIATAGR